MEAVRELSDAERIDLRAKLTTKNAELKSRSLGFKVRGQSLVQGPVIAKIPTSLADAELSVCGVKGFLVDEVREFERPDGVREIVDCAHIALLEIADSPVHVHGGTQETYEIRRGKGKMILGDRIVEVEAGAVLKLLPGDEHGLVSDDPMQPVEALLHFTPGLAPKTKPEFRDEAILYDRTSERIAELLNRSRDQIAQTVEIAH